MKWQVRKSRAWALWLVSDPQGHCRYFDEWRDAIRYAVWHATGQQEPLS